MIIDENYDFVSGTRYKNGGKRLGGSLIGHLLSFIANKSFSFITKFPLSDLTTGIKMFKKNCWFQNQESQLSTFTQNPTNMMANNMRDDFEGAGQDADTLKLGAKTKIKQETW